MGSGPTSRTLYFKFIVKDCLPKIREGLPLFILLSLAKLLETAPKS